MGPTFIPDYRVLSVHKEWVGAWMVQKKIQKNRSLIEILDAKTKGRIRNLE